MQGKIELLGLPCSGKTTYLNNNKLTFSHADDSHILIRLLASVFFIFIDIRVFIYILKTFKYIKLKYFYMHLKGVIRFYSRLFEVCYLKKKDNIQEEGIFQAFWGLFMFMTINQGSLIIAKNILSRTSFPERGIVYFPCSKNVVISRNLNRTNKRTRFLNLIQSKHLKQFTVSRDWLAYLLLYAKENNINVKVVFSK